MEKQFAQGMIVRLPHEKAPNYVKMRLGFKVADFTAWLSQHENNNGYCDIDILESKDGTKLYGVLNDYKPQKPNMNNPEYPADEVDPNDVPF